MTPMGGKVYFRADDGIKGKELWASDGTKTGTKQVKDIKTGDNSHSSPVSMAARRCTQSAPALASRSTLSLFNESPPARSFLCDVH